MKTYYIFIILYFLFLSGYWIGFNNYCIQRFDFCHSEQLRALEENRNPKCGIYYIDYWDYTLTVRLYDFILSFIRCEGVL